MQSIGDRESCWRPLALGVCVGLSKWLCNQFGQSLQKYFLRRKIFLAEKKYISCGEKYISCGEKYISCGEKCFLRRKIFLAEKNISCGKKYISCGEKFISCGKIYFLRRKIYFLRKKYISCGEKYISCGEKYFLRKKKYFLRKNIFCTMLPISFRATPMVSLTCGRESSGGITFTWDWLVWVFRWKRSRRWSQSKWRHFLLIIWNKMSMFNLLEKYML